MDSQVLVNPRGRAGREPDRQTAGGGEEGGCSPGAFYTFLTFKPWYMAPVTCKTLPVWSCHPK